MEKNNDKKVQLIYKTFNKEEMKYYKNLMFCCFEISSIDMNRCTKLITLQVV